MENKRLGIICFDNRKVFTTLMNNYRLALESYFGVENLKYSINKRFRKLRLYFHNR